MPSSRSTLILALALLAIGSAGCVGPTAIRGTRIRYNETYQKTNDQQLLLNIVRLRYAESPVLIDLPAITGQYEAGAVGGFNSPFDTLDPGIPNFAVGQLLYRDTPTLSYHPRKGHEIAETLINPVNAEVLRVMSPGTDTLKFLMMAVNDVNDVPNAPLATSLNPRLPESNHRFREVADLFVRLQERGAAELEVATVSADDFDPLPIDQIGGTDVAQAARDGYEFRIEGERAVMRKREKAIILAIRPQDIHAPDVRRLTDALGLAPGRRAYKIISEQVAADDFDDMLPEPLGSDTIRVNMRSVMDIMVFLAKGVQVPPDHITRRIAPITPGYDGRPHDWRDISAGLICVKSQKHRPKHADVAVQYRGYWFYIDESDVTSRETIALLETLLEIQEVQGDAQAPLLTLPLN